MKISLAGAARTFRSRIANGSWPVGHGHQSSTATSAYTVPSQHPERGVVDDHQSPVADRVPTRLSPSTMFDSSRLGFSPVVICPPEAGLVFISGQLASDPRSDFEGQVGQAFLSLRAALDAAGATPQTVLRITCLVVDHDPERRTVVSNARLQFFRGHGPASTIIPVPRLAEATALFEIDAIAMTRGPVTLP
ncbi:MAG: RidA family protein [Nocardioides sp.]